MADQSDVETQLASLVAAALYPQGSDQPSLAGPLCRIYRGWPNAAALDADLAAGWVNVTIFPAGGPLRNTTRYPVAWFTAAQQVPTLEVSVTGLAATFGGSADAGQIAGLIVDGQTFAYATVAGDSPALVAAQLAAQVRLGRIAQLSGTSVSVPGAAQFSARVVAGAEGLSEVRRQVQDFRVTCWCPTPALRDHVASIVDVAMAQIMFMALPDGSQARVRFAGSSVVDRAEDAQLYRRDLTYSVEYATTLTQEQPAMLFGDGLLNSLSFIG
jgi:hypothetical protein